LTEWGEAAIVWQKVGNGVKSGQGGCG
jgi:hypothetical protein